MAENTDEGNLNSTSIPSLENLSDQDNPAIHKETINIIPETKNMEVHKHPHHVMHKKKWAEYLLEFFMLFLAVFLGFVAENFREGTIERHREKEYIESMVKDLKTDTTRLTKVIKRYKRLINWQDSLLNAFEFIDKGGNKSFVRLMEKSISGFPDFVHTDATVQQLKNSGGFRLLQNKRAVDSIISYISDVNMLALNTADMGNWLHQVNIAQTNTINYMALDKAKEKYFDLDQMQKLFISKDEIEKEKFYGKVFQYSRIMRIVLRQNLIPLRQHAISLIAFLQKEYRLENE